MHPAAGLARAGRRRCLYSGRRWQGMELGLKILAKVMAA
jgi:hypothetical protein